MKSSNFTWEKACLCLFISIGNFFPSLLFIFVILYSEVAIMSEHFIKSVILVLYLCHNGVLTDASCYDFLKIAHAVSYLYSYLCPCIILK